MPKTQRAFTIRIIDGFRPYEVLEDGRRVLRFREARLAKSFRKALDWAINDQEMNTAVAMLYAVEKAHDEITACLETDEPDEHFLPG